MELVGHHLESVDSTNEHAFRAIAAGEARHGDAFLAREQTAGRGTRGRRWVSVPGGLYLSVTLSTEALPAPGLWTIAGGMAALDVARSTGVDAALDWPNDLVRPSGDAGAAPAKLGGILAESRDVHPDRPPHWFVLGIGLNVLRSAVDPGVAAERPVTSLEGEGAAVSLAAASSLMLAKLGARLGQAVGDPAALHADFFDACLQAGHPVEVEVGKELRRGVFEALDGARGVGLRSAGGDLSWISLAFVRSMRLTDAAD